MQIMKLRHLLYFLLLFISCGRSKQAIVSDTDAYLPEVILDDSVEYFSIKDNRITVDLNKPQQASLFDYFKHIELIPLETNDNVLIGRMWKIIYHKNRYYALDIFRPKYKVFVFDESGKFIKQIGSYGQGPGEYYYMLDDMLINPFTGNIDLLSAWGHIYTYDLSGKHVKTSSKFTKHSADENDFHAAQHFIALDKKTYVFYSVFDRYKIIYYDIDEMKIIRQVYEDDSFAESIIVPYFYEYRGEWYFYRSSRNDTYKIYPDTLVKNYTWDFGKFNYDINKMSHSDYSNNIMQQKDDVDRLPYRFRLQGQNNLYVIAEIRLKNDIPAYLMYNKSTHESKFIERFTEAVYFRPKTITNEYVLSYCLHGELPDFITNEMLDESNRQKFKKLMEIKDEMNPIIIKYYFK